MGNYQFEQYRKAVEELVSHDADLLKAVKDIGSLISGYQTTEHQNKELEEFQSLNLTQLGELRRNDPEKYKKLEALSGKNALDRFKGKGR